jgi:heme-degrading monooxygenase HmoA
MKQQVVDQFSSGTWRVLDGREREFITRWTEFLEWTRSSSKDLHEARLIQDSDDPNHFVSFASWSSGEAMQRWRSSAEFATKLAACRALCSDFRGSSYTLAAAV